MPADPTDVKLNNTPVLLNCTGGGFLTLGSINCEVPNDADVNIAPILTAFGVATDGQIVGISLQSSNTGPALDAGGAGVNSYITSGDDTFGFRNLNDGSALATTGNTAGVHFGVMITT